MDCPLYPRLMQLRERGNQVAAWGERDDEHYMRYRANDRRGETDNYRNERRDSGGGNAGGLVWDDSDLISEVEMYRRQG